MSFFKRMLAGVTLLAVLNASRAMAALKFVLPSDLKVIESGAFSGVDAGEIQLPEGVERIESLAFTGGSQINLPDSLKHIAPDALPEGITAVVKPGSFAHLWCIAYHPNYRMQWAVGQRMRVRFQADGRWYTASASSAPDVARVDEDGWVLGISRGDSVIQVSDDSGHTVNIDLKIIGYSEVCQPLCVAHRGASGYYRENTLEAFEKAYEMGADAVELDVHKTRDGVIVVYHDKSIKVGSQKEAIADLTYKQLIKADKYICTFQQAVDCIRKTDMMMLVEFKTTGIAGQVIEIVEAGQMVDRTMYSSFNLNILQEVKQLCPEADVSYPANSQSRIDDILAHPEKYPVDGVGIYYRYIDEVCVRDMHLIGKDVYAWTVNTREIIQTCIEAGVDGILTNYPDYMAG